MADDLNLPSNPTVADIEQEILFHHVVLASIDPNDVCSDATKAEIEDKILRLNAMLAERNDAAAAGRKRARVDSQSGDATRVVKSHRGSPRPETPDSLSDDDIEFLLSRPIDQSVSRGVKHQVKMEKRLADQQQQMKRDARMARDMRSPQHRLGTLVQTTLDHNSQLLRPSPPETLADGRGLVLRSPKSQIATPPQVSNHTSPKIKSPVVHLTSGPRNLSQEEQSSLQIGAVSDSESDDSIEEISASDFRPSSRVIDRNRQPQMRPSSRAVDGNRLPQLQNPNFTLQYSRSEPQLNAHNSFGQYGTNSNQYANKPYFWGGSYQSTYPSTHPAPYMPPPSFGSLMNNLRGFGGAHSSIAHSSIAHSSIGNGLGSASSAYPSEYSYLYSDPTRNAEEIRQLLKNIRSDEDLPPELRKGTPPEMATTLLEHQKLGLSWLARQEEGSNKGGILADDMGLGKTIQAIALMVSRRAEDDRKTNLIVGPVALLGQWQSEIEEKVKSRSKLTVFRYHGTKSTWDKLRKYDVVLTTYGTLGSEWKRYNERETQKLLSDEDLPPLDLPLIGRDSKWYRVILDEAQNIKNKESHAAKGSFMLKSVYRLCMTGTPMMNNVTELYSLIRFCRIKPFDNWETYNNEIGKPLNVNSSRRYSTEQAMRKLRGLICATMLRRTKKSTLDGKPLINLPEREIQDDEISFGSEEQEFYQGLETKAQGVINSYMERGNLGKKYIHALVLLLRLRQACCHPYLVTINDQNTPLDVPADTLLELAGKLADDVVARIKAEDGEFECPICLDPTFNPVILLGCGHTTCSECFSTMKQNCEAELPCPVCRGSVHPQRITDYTSFKKVYFDDQGEENASETDSEEDDETSSLDGFVVDEDEDYETTEISDHKKKGKSNGRGKRKSLAQLKREGLRNQKARRRYIRRLRKNYQPSSKITRTLALLDEIDASHPVEKVLVFSQFTTLLDILEVALEPTNRRFQRYDGSMSAKDRAAAVDAFRKDPLTRLMLVSLKAGNAGLNLNIASQVIILDPFWNPYIEDQAIDRAHRIGQRFDVMVHRVIVPGTVEDRILKLQADKRGLINDALDEMESKNIGRLGQRDLAFLFGLDKL